MREGRNKEIKIKNMHVIQYIHYVTIAYNQLVSVNLIISYYSFFSNLTGFFIIFKNISRNCLTRSNNSSQQSVLGLGDCKARFFGGSRNNFNKNTRLQILLLALMC